MKVIGTDKIKGVLNLSCVGAQLAKGQSLYVRDDDFWQTEIQESIRLGFLRSEGKPSENYEDDGDMVIQCKNTHFRSISMRANDREIKPGQVFTLKKRELDSPEVKQAVSLGMIKPLSAGGAETSEGSVSVTKLLTGEEPEEIDGFEDSEEELNISSLLANKPQPRMDTNEEISTPTVIIREDAAKPIEDDKGVAWNSPEEETTVRAQSPTRVITSDKPDPVDPDIDDPKGKSVVIDPNKQTRYMNYKRDNEVVFVDKKQEKEKIDSHPTMSTEAKKLAAQNEDLDVIENADEDEKRRQQHPVLGKQSKEDDGIEFIG